MNLNWKTWAILGAVIAVAIVIGGYLDDQRFKMSQKSAANKNPKSPVSPQEQMEYAEGGY